MIVTNIDREFREYLEKNNKRWIFGNDILYQMCKKNPKHDDEDVIVGKIWLIGRSYAAAIERRKDPVVDGDDFYYDTVAPKMLDIGKELDLKIAELNMATGTVEDNIEAVLDLHKFLTDVFNDITKMEKRSLASKYLHFHCPDKFFIYDSRANIAIRKIVKRPDKTILLNANDYYDHEYGDFVCHVLELQKYLKEDLGYTASPREIDSFLLELFSRN